MYTHETLIQASLLGILAKSKCLDNINKDRKRKYYNALPNVFAVHYTKKL